jgi:hypothetical protein
MELYPYLETRQFEKYISQFARIFKGFQYDKGDGEEFRIPVVYGGMSRIVAGILSKNDVHQNNRLPMIAVNMTGINMDQLGKRPRTHVDSVANVAVQGSTKVVNRLVGPAFVMDMEVSIYASSNLELFNILEQILLIFNPRVTIKVDTNMSSGNFLTEASLESIQKEIQYPLGTERDIVSLSMNFSVPVRLNYPKEIQDTIIKKITQNVIDGNNGQSIMETEIGG